MPIDRHRVAFLEPDHDLLGLIRGIGGVHGESEHLGRGCGPGVLQDSALVRDVEEVGIHRVGLLPGDRHRYPAFLGVLDEGRAPVEVPFPPGGNHPEIGGQRGHGELEADLIVALARRTVGDGVGAEGAGSSHQTLGDYGPGQGGPEQVMTLVDRAGPQGGVHGTVDETMGEVLDHCLHGSGRDGLLLGLGGLGTLTHVSGVSDHVRTALLAEPGQDHRRVEAT